jgi:Fe-S cluster biogenesis protein NfuA
MENHTVLTPELKDKIEKALDTIRPYLEADGGNVKVGDLNQDMVLQLELLGACGTCPMSAMTLKAGVEEAIKKAIPEITSVEAINLTAPGDQNAKMPS